MSVITYSLIFQSEVKHRFSFFVIFSDLCGLPYLLRVRDPHPSELKHNLPILHYKILTQSVSSEKLLLFKKNIQSIKSDDWSKPLRSEHRQHHVNMEPESVNSSILSHSCEETHTNRDETVNKWWQDPQQMIRIMHYGPEKQTRLDLNRWCPAMMQMLKWRK